MHSLLFISVLTIEERIWGQQHSIPLHLPSYKSPNHSCLNLLICKMGLRTAPTSSGSMRIQRAHNLSSARQLAKMEIMEMLSLSHQGAMSLRGAVELLTGNKK